MSGELADNCPRCQHPATKPVREAEDYHGNTTAWYRCPTCAHTWWTTRQAPEEQPPYATFDDPDAWEADL